MGWLAWYWLALFGAWCFLVGYFAGGLAMINRKR